MKEKNSERMKKRKSGPTGKEEQSHPPKAGFPVIGIGASAGGLAAIEAFFSGMPADSDPEMAFVLVQHLAPDHKSILTDLIQRYTRMQVFEVEDGMIVHPNCAYIIPPNRDMAFLNGTLQLMEPSAPRGHRLPIDFFFRSLAQDQRERAIGIILSGTGSDGTQGIRAIKGEGGMVMAQNPASTEYDGMPRSAIVTGLVDFELPPAEMPAQLIAYLSHTFVKALRPATIQDYKPDNVLKKIFVLLRAQTNHDFSQYKHSTINRRIERRMAVLQIDSIDSYLKHLQQTPTEVEALFHDLLIRVTSFFRDPETFKALEEKVIPRLFSGKLPNSFIRVWSPGCSTGEEAYSLAIILNEHMEALKQRFRIQIFATDIDSQAIGIARSGLYPASITTDITAKRLARFFVPESDGGFFRIHKGIRDMLIFSEQDAIKDPPFSKLDLISCRNLLIYMSGELQKRIIPLFHYALNPGGFLFLGTSETVGEFSNLFTSIDRKLKLFQRKEDFSTLRVPLGRFPTSRPKAEEVFTPSPPARLGFGVAGSKIPLRELTEQAILQLITPAAALVNELGDILYLHGRTGLFLEPAPGEAGVNNILKMAREGLLLEITTALHKAVEAKEIVRRPGLQVKTNGNFAIVNLIVCPVMKSTIRKNEPFLYLVVLEEVTMTVNPPAPPPIPGEDEASNDVDLRILALKQELWAKEEYLKTTNEELETSNEELRSYNEEMQSVNEELQSTNEELETSKEEMQSMNEELATVNTELQTKMTDLSRANNDMNNLLAGTGIGTIFVDEQLRILRFTPSSTEIINLILSDIGRPVGHIASNLVGYDRLTMDAQTVLDTLIPKEMEVQTRAGAWYTMRIQPYRTLDNMILGVVLTFSDITLMKQTQAELLKSKPLLRLAAIVHDSQEAITMHDFEGHILAWNPGAVRMYGWSEAEALAMNVRDLIPQDLRQKELAKMGPLGWGGCLEPYQTYRLAKNGHRVKIWITATALGNETGEIYAVSTIERKISGYSERKQDERKKNRTREREKKPG